MDKETQKIVEEIGRTQLADSDTTGRTIHLGTEENDIYIVMHVTRNKMESVSIYESAIAVSRCWPSAKAKK